MATVLSAIFSYQKKNFTNSFRLLHTLPVFFPENEHKLLQINSILWLGIPFNG